MKILDTGEVLEPWRAVGMEGVDISHRRGGWGGEGKEGDDGGEVFIAMSCRLSQAQGIAEGPPRLWRN